MPHFFCSESSRQAGEDIIGSGTNYQTYVLIECPPPWTADAFETPAIPDNLKSLIKEVKQSKRDLRFLLIASNQSKSNNFTKVLIYEQSQEEFSQGYNKQEFNVEKIEQVAEVVRNYFSGNDLSCQREISETRDILVCTHGSHDKCCAKYGNPFYVQALGMVSDLNLSDVRVWKASHFGGHRFAPTAINFPDGRYYGVLDQQSFHSILTRTGDLQFLNKVYRGWGILPNKIQVLERELILRHGWDWFNYKVSAKLSKNPLDETRLQAQIKFKKPNNSLYSYHAELVKSEEKTLQLRGSCCATQQSEFVKYLVENICLYSEKRRIQIHENVGDIKIIKSNSLLHETESFVEA
jgi:hypothetical protein